MARLVTDRHVGMPIGRTGGDTGCTVTLGYGKADTIPLIPTAPDSNSTSLLPITPLTQVNDPVRCRPPSESNAMFDLRRRLRKLKRKELAPEVSSRRNQHSNQAIEHTSDFKTP